ncbi:hypothetical protein H2201_002721 [Coniosporium apollinis]|uniref:DUF8004 domain-containing protein n=1 Tax=Coniosporium apollinis TaxID=61459 RepID=A0ABQ9NXT9_9PEZI|nr:hypothetical protein H2201_002721 [Coniosporium apollinis]
MDPSKKDRSSSRLSSLFSLSSSGSEPAFSIDDGKSESSSSRRSARLSLSPSRRTSPKRLSKAAHERVPSGQLLSPVAYPSPSPRRGQINPVDPAQTGAVFPPPVNDAFYRDESPVRSRPGSRPPSRPLTPTLDLPRHDSRGMGPPVSYNNQSQAKPKRRSWFGGGSRDKHGPQEQAPLAWVIGHETKLPYNLSLLLNAEKVPELWDEHGDTFVYLFPRTSGKGPSFCIDRSLINASPILTRMAYGSVYSQPAPQSSVWRQQPLDGMMDNLSVAIPTPPRSPVSMADTESLGDSKGSRPTSDGLEPGPVDTHLYIPLKLSTDGALPSDRGAEPRATPEDVDTLISIRNLFAFLVGQSLVATEKRFSTFSIFMNISEQLNAYGFTNIDRSTFGEVASISFDNYVDELQLADVRGSREKTIEGIVLGERMRSVMLYNEAFVHGVGKYEELTNLNSPKFQLISPITRNRMERASMDLYIRLKNINSRLEDFDFPAIFAGIMNSKTADERKMVRFSAWKASFMSTRKWLMGYYKHKYGSWPPKASSKKNDLETSGLNRLVLKDLYHDFAHLYDLLVDRTSLTTRTVDAASADDGADDTEDVVARALRRVLSEYDRSSPPVLPPIPFDIPILPTLPATKKDPYGRDVKPDARARQKKLKDDQVHNILGESYNPDSEISTPFIDAFLALERKDGHGATIDQLIDNRCGQWIFMYAVLQALPYVVVDAPGIKWTQGVEYFLCEPPRSSLPWAREDTGVQRSWYGIAGSSGVVSLPSDVVEHGVEGIYRRSHCWEMAERWSAADPLLAAAAAETLHNALPPPGVLQEEGSRPASPTRSKRESVMMLGLEQLPLPAGVAPIAPSPNLRPASSTDASKTFDAILGTSALPPQKGKKKK